MSMRSLATFTVLVFALACTAGGTSKKKTDGGAGSGGMSGSGGKGGSGGAGGTGGGSGGSGGTGGSGGSGGKGGGGGSGGGSGGASGVSCLEIQKCSNECMDADCVSNCVSMGSSSAQDQFNMLDMCISDNCPMGGMDCACMTQCTSDGACKALNEACVGMSPDPDCATACP